MKAWPGVTFGFDLATDEEGGDDEGPEEEPSVLWIRKDRREYQAAAAEYNRRCLHMAQLTELLAFVVPGKLG
jgi:hypothetical protein